MRVPQVLHRLLLPNLTVGGLVIIVSFLIFNTYLARNAFSAPNFKKAGKKLGPVLHWNLALQLVPVTKRSILHLLSGSSFERCVRFHRWLGRWTVFLASIHATGFLLAWNDDGELLEKLLRTRNFYGFAAFSTLLTLLLTSLSNLRRHWYNFFRVVHGFGFLFLVIFVSWHYDADKFWAILAVPLILYVLDWVLRLYRMQRFRILNAEVIGDDVAVRLEIPALAHEPGQFVFVQIPSVSPFEWHPFSLCIGNSPERVALVVSQSGDWTGRLQRMAQAGSVGDWLRVDGPFGNIGLDLDEYDSVVLVAGGAGFTPLLPILTNLQHKFPSGSEARRLLFVWTLKHVDLVEAYAQTLEDAAQFAVDTRVFLTQGGAGLQMASQLKGIRVGVGRPDVLAELRAEKDRCLTAGVTRTAVIVSGPQSLLEASRSAVVTLNREASQEAPHEFCVHSETFEI